MRIAVIMLASLLAAHAEDVAGHYFLQGLREVGSELLLRPNGTFEFMLAYGAADLQASGTWRREADAVILKTAGKKEEPFRLLRSAESKAAGVRIWVKAPNGRPVENIDVALKTDAGFTQARTGPDGAAQFETDKLPRAAAFRVNVYDLEAGPFELNSAHRDFYFEINGDAITRVPFEDERLAIDGNNLLMRYFDKDTPMRYVRNDRRANAPE
jgi:hypothetical protein